MSGKRPNSMRHLDDAIRRTCGGSADGYLEARTLMATAVVARMLPDGVVKGGAAIKMRLGDMATRFTTDLDTATATDPDEYASKLAESLSTGWEGFTGRVVPAHPAKPKNVPPEYVMRPFEVKLSFKGKPWCTVLLEVGHNEIGDAENADWVELADAASLFEKIGFPDPGNAPLMPLHFQIAQKLHAVTGGSDRVRDLVDLQLLVACETVDYVRTRRVCERLFAYRKSQDWPPVVQVRDGWAERYQEASEGLEVLPDVTSAVAWTNRLIEKIATA